ncbi:MAG: flagellar export chaperone FliS [Candidatus Gastranaerophilales bacterium]|nr:flagellar export chaperone FliS [Candidatus Gastranaerophilales bacterium]
MNQYVKQYQKSSIETASREQILIMLYDGAIQFLNKAKIAMRNHDIEAAHNNLMGAQNIIQEFIDSMDREVAPQLAENLISLYEYFIRRLVQANLKKQVQPIDEVLGYLKNLKATWEKAIIIAQKEEQEKAMGSYKNSDDDEDEYIDDDYDDDEDDEDED